MTTREQVAARMEANRKRMDAALDKTYREWLVSISENEINAEWPLYVGAGA